MSYGPNAFCRRNCNSYVRIPRSVIGNLGLGKAAPTHQQQRRVDERLDTIAASPPIGLVVATIRQSDHRARSAFQSSNARSNRHRNSRLLKRSVRVQIPAPCPPRRPAAVEVPSCQQERCHRHVAAHSCGDCEYDNCELPRSVLFIGSYRMLIDRE